MRALARPESGSDPRIVDIDVPVYATSTSQGRTTDGARHLLIR